jgi:plastocyanin
VPPPTPGGAPPTVVGAPTQQPDATGAATSPVAAASVTITAELRFDPSLVAIERGQAVVWRNTGRPPQTVTDDPRLVSDPSHVALPAGAQPFDSGVINSGSTWSHTFDVPGEYQYVSLPFEVQNMTGRVSVRG